MSVSNPFTHSNVTVNWNGHNAQTVNFGTDLLHIAVAKCVTSGFIMSNSAVTLPTSLTIIIEELLNAIHVLPAAEMHKKITLADRLFESLTVITTNPYNPVFMRMFWRAVFEFVWKWEDANEKVHKGTPFYFMADTYLKAGDLTSAYICFFNALEEDKRSYPFIPKKLQDAPAYRTTSLVDNAQNNLYQDEVVPLRKRLQQFIDGYNTRTGRSLIIQTLDQKFLQDDNFEEIKRVFVGNFREIYHLDALNTPRMIINDYSKLKIIDTLFNLALVIDQTLHKRFGSQDMANGIYSLALHHWRQRATSAHAGEFTAKVHPRLNHTTPDQVIPLLLTGSATFGGNPLTPLEVAIFTAYHLRNFAGHNIQGSQIIVDRYFDVLSLMMDALFLTIETL